MFRTDLYLGGNWRSVSDGGCFDVINPADETVLASVASATETDELAAVEAAHRHEKLGGEASTRTRRDSSARL